MNKELKILSWAAGLGAGLILILKYLFPLIAPFLCGFILACLIEPLVEKVNARFKISRKLSIFLILSGLVCSILIITGFSLIAFYQEAQRLIPQIPNLANKILAFFQEWTQNLSRNFPQLNETLQNYLIPTHSVVQLFRSIITGLINFLPHFPQLLFAIGLGGFTAYYFSRDKKIIGELFGRLLPRRWQQATAEIKKQFISSISRYVRIEFTLAFVTSILTVGILALLGIPGAFAYGFLAGIFDFLPVFGSGLIYIPLIIINLLYHQFYSAFWLIGAYFLVIMIRQVVEFKFIGQNLNLHPILSVLVIYLGFTIFGFLGIFFSPFFVIVIRTFYRFFNSLEQQQSTILSFQRRCKQ